MRLQATTHSGIRIGLQSQTTINELEPYAGSTTRITSPTAFCTSYLVREIKNRKGVGQQSTAASYVGC